MRINKISSIIETNNKYKKKTPDALSLREVNDSASEHAQHSHQSGVHCNGIVTTITATITTTINKPAVYLSTIERYSSRLRNDGHMQNINGQDEVAENKNLSAVSEKYNNDELECIVKPLSDDLIQYFHVETSSRLNDSYTSKNFELSRMNNKSAQVAKAYAIAQW